jgi:hypothetical protein
MMVFAPTMLMKIVFKQSTPIEKNFCGDTQVNEKMNETTVHIDFLKIFLCYIKKIKLL